MVMACALYSADSVTLIFKEAQLIKYHLDLQMKMIRSKQAFINYEEEKLAEIADLENQVQDWKSKYDVCAKEKKDVIAMREQDNHDAKNKSIA